MQLQLQTFTGLVQGMAAAAQSSASAVLNLAIGSTLRAVLEASASAALWMQWLILQVLQVTRAATSAGSDLDTWLADFGFIRLPAVTATGSVTMSRFTSSGSALIVPGATVKTADGTQSFVVTTDTSNTLWNAGQGGYLIPGGTASGTVPIAAVNPGAQGNVGAGTISLLASAVSGIDTVTNAVALTNGIDAEADDTVRARFVDYINTRDQATVLAIGYAIYSVQQGLVWTVAENQNADGSANVGNFVVTIDDGSGTPGADLIASVSAAVNPVRPIGSTYLVRAPTVTAADVSFTIVVAAGINRIPLLGAAATAVTAYINALWIGQTMPYSVIAKLVYDSAPAGQIVNVTSITLNGGTVDLTVGIGGVVRAGTVAAN